MKLGCGWHACRHGPSDAILAGHNGAVVTHCNGQAAIGRNGI